MQRYTVSASFFENGIQCQLKVCEDQFNIMVMKKSRYDDSTDVGTLLQCNARRLHKVREGSRDIIRKKVK